MKSLETVALGDFVEQVRTWNPAASCDTDVFDYIDLSAVSQESKRIVAARTVRCAEAPSRARQIVMQGDLLVSTVRPNLNAVAEVPENLHGATASTGFCVLRTRAGFIERRYLFHWVTSQAFVTDMVRKATGASYPAVSDRIILDSRLLLPALAEQRRIADLLDRADALRAKRRRAIAQIGTLAEATLVRMFGNPLSNPRGWPLQRLGEAADVQGGLQVSRSRNTLPVEVPYLRVANVYRGVLNLSEIKTMRATSAEVARTTLRQCDLLIVEGHGNAAEIGRCALWDGSIARCIHQNHLIRARFNRERVDPVFASAFLNSYGGRQHLLRAGSTTSGLNTISVSDVRSTPIATPPIKLQRQFAEAVAAIDSVKSVQRASLSKNDALFASLQHRAFRGEL